MKKNTIKLTMALLVAPIVCHAAVIVEDDVEGNGDVSAITGTIVVAWAGWGGVGSPADNYFSGLLDPAKDDDVGVGGPADQLPLEAVNGLVPFANGGAVIGVGYGGTVAAGTYTLTMQVANWSNAGFSPIVGLTLGGLSPTGSGANPHPAPGDDEIYTYTFAVATGAPEIGNGLGLTFGLGATAGENAAVDHVIIDFTPIPEPTSGLLALVSVGAIVLRRRRR